MADRNPRTSMHSITQLDPGEVQRFRRLRLAALQDAPDAFSGTYEAAAARSDAAWAEQLRAIPTFVAMLDGRDVGVVRTALQTPNGDTAELYSMWVAPEGRGIGLGDALVTAVMDWSRVQGATTLVLGVEAGNRHGIALYERMGFRATGETLPYPLPRRHLVEVRMSIELQDRLATKL